LITVFVPEELLTREKYIRNKYCKQKNANVFKGKDHHWMRNGLVHGGIFCIIEFLPVAKFLSGKYDCTKYKSPPEYAVTDSGFT
jgi:hypothetical protein